MRAGARSSRGPAALALASTFASTLAAAFAAAFAATVFVAGCARPGCAGGPCRTSPAACDEGQRFDGRKCACQRGRRPVGGRCLDAPQADAFCGLDATFGDDGCAERACQAGAIFDLGLRTCVDRAAVERANGLAPGQSLACPPGSSLAIDREVGACVVSTGWCARDEAARDGACVKRPACPLGAIADPTLGVCVPFVTPPKGDELRPLLDVVAWSQATFGVDGGQGAAAFCGPLARRPLDFGALPGASKRVRVVIALRFARHDVAGAAVTTASFDAAGVAPLAGRAADDVRAAAEALVAGVGPRAKASRDEVTSVVSCEVAAAATPLVVGAPAVSTSRAVGAPAVSTSRVVGAPAPTPAESARRSAPR